MRLRNHVFVSPERSSERDYTLILYLVRSMYIVERFSRAGPRGRGREWATLGVHPLSWLLSNNRLEKVPFVSVLHTSSNRLMLSNQDKGCTPSVAHSLLLPLGPGLLNLWSVCMYMHVCGICKIDHCIHIHWCIPMGLGHNDPWVESHMWPQQMWGQSHLEVNDLRFKF